MILLAYFCIDGAHNMEYIRDTYNELPRAGLMNNNSRPHIVSDIHSPVTGPSHLTRQEFGRRLLKLINAKGWRQADLARRAGIPRDAISKYIRGVIFPSPPKLEALAQALGVKSEELLPNIVEKTIDNDVAELEMKISTNSPKVAWLRVNRLVTTTTALKIMELLNDDKPLDVGE